MESDPAVVILELPFPPKSEDVSKNSRKFWAKQSGIAAVYKQECFAEGHKAWMKHGQLRPPVHARIVFVVDSRRKRDWDNLITQFKSGQDGIVKSRLLIDDDIWRLRPSYDVELGAKAGVRVELVGAPS